MVIEYICIVIYSWNVVDESFLNIPVFKASLYHI